MAEQSTNLTDMLDHSPDIMADEKVKVMMSDIYNEMVVYVNQDNSKKVAAIISNYGTNVFIEWFIDNVYLPKTADVKIMAYVAEHKGDICDILGQAMSNLTSKEVMDNAEEDKVADGEGEDEGSQDQAEGKDGGSQDQAEGGDGAPEKQDDGAAPEGKDVSGAQQPEHPAEEEHAPPDGAAEPPEKDARTYEDELLDAVGFVDSLLR